MRVRTDHWNLLIMFCETNPELITNRFKGIEGRAKAAELWQNIAIQLNSLGYGEKSVESWRKAFTDWKSKTKSKAAALKRERQKTGGGTTELPPLSAVEEKLLQIMGNRALDGDDLVQEFGLGQVRSEVKTPNIQENKENISTKAISKTPNVANTSHQCHQDVISVNKDIKRKLDDNTDPLKKKVKITTVRNRTQSIDSLLTLNRETVEILKNISKNTKDISRSLQEVSSNTESISNSLLIIAETRNF